MFERCLPSIPVGKTLKKSAGFVKKLMTVSTNSGKNNNIYTLFPKLIRAGLDGELYDEHQANTAVKLAKYEAMEKTIELIKILDHSEDSQWLAEYMIDETSTISEVKELFKNYLHCCEHLLAQKINFSAALSR